MLGAVPHVDFSLANRTLLFDIDRADWSEELIQHFQLDAAKLPKPVPSGSVIGEVSPCIAKELGCHHRLRSSLVLMISVRMH